MPKRASSLVSHVMAKVLFFPLHSLSLLHQTSFSHLDVLLFALSLTVGIWVRKMVRRFLGHTISLKCVCVCLCVCVRVLILENIKDKNKDASTLDPWTISSYEHQSLHSQKFMCNLSLQFVSIVLYPCTQPV